MAANRPKGADETPMELKELKEKHPDLYAQVIAEGKAQGRNEAQSQLQEQQRLQDLRSAKLTELQLPASLQEQARKLLAGAATEADITAQAEALKVMVTELAQPPKPGGNPPPPKNDGFKFID